MVKIDPAHVVRQVTNGLRQWRYALRIAAILSASCLGWGTGAEAAGDLACIVKPYMEVSVGTPVEGIIQQVHVDRGDWVTKGQAVVTLEASVEKATVDLAKAKADGEATIKGTQAKIAFSTRKLERATELYKSNSIAKHELDEAHTEKTLAETAYLEAIEKQHIDELEWHRATAALNLRTISSPLSGVVVDRLLSPGELAGKTPILKLAQINPLRIEVYAPVEMLGKLAVGKTALVKPEPPLTGQYSAKITVVDRVVDAASGTFGVRLEMPNPNNTLQAGLRCTVKFHVAQ